MAQVNVAKLVGDAILAEVLPQLGSLSLVTSGWSQNLKDPIYPVNPRNTLPALLLRSKEDDVRPLSGMRGTEATYVYSLFYYKRVTTGSAANQTSFRSDLDLIASCFTGKWRNLSAISGFKLNGIYPRRILLSNEMGHEWGDPDLRVMVGEVQIEVEAYLIES